MHFGEYGSLPSANTKTCQSRCPRAGYGLQVAKNKPTKQGTRLAILEENKLLTGEERLGT
jgi:hypothetical protein